MGINIFVYAQYGDIFVNQDGDRYMYVRYIKSNKTHILRLASCDYAFGADGNAIIGNEKLTTLEEYNEYETN